MLKNELIKLLHRKSLYIAIVIGILSCVCGLFSYYDTAYWANSAGYPEEISAYNAWLDCLSVGSSIYRVLLPLIIVPFLDSYLLERTSGYQNYVLTRAGRNRYFFTKWITGVISAVGITFLVLSVTLVICVVLFPLNQPLESMTHLHKNFGLDLFLRRPGLCIFLMILSNMFFSAVYYTIGFACSNFVRNRYFLLLIPFILYIAQLLIWQFFHLPCVSPLVFIAYYEVLGLTPFSMLITGIIYFLVAAVLLLWCYLRDSAIS